VLNALALLASMGLLADIALHAPTDLVAAAAASGRPAECMPVKTTGPTRRNGVWARARIPNLQRYCALIARAHARINESPTSARIAATKAEELVPGRAAPQVVLARVALIQGKVLAAQKAFALALTRNPRGVEQPVAMHDLALTQWRTGKLEEALSTYRVLVPRAALLPNRHRRAQVLLEAAHLAMAVAPNKPDEQSRILDESLAYLREASRDSNHPLAIDVALSLVLALDRAGRRVQADAILSEQRGSATWAASATWATSAVPSKLSYLASKHDLLVMRGLALEQHDRAAAAKSYRQYLDGAGGKGPFAAVVKTRLSNISQAPARRRRPR
jgi:tetratricopeptide (TPR) repeat protein